MNCFFLKELQQVLVKLDGKKITILREIKNFKNFKCCQRKTTDDRDFAVEPYEPDYYTEFQNNIECIICAKLSDLFFIRNGSKMNCKVEKFPSNPGVCQFDTRLATKTFPSQSCLE